LQRQQAELQRQAEVQRQLEEQSRQHMQQRQLEQQARAQAQASRRISPLGAGTSTESMMPAVDIAMPRGATPNTPSIMLSPELEAEMTGGAAGRADDATARNSRSGFADTNSESLIIDFGAADRSADSDELPVVEGQQQPIRPAARPMGKAAAPAVSAPRQRRAADEGPPTSMPPPTRRR
jgi:hypothetical protein